MKRMVCSMLLLAALALQMILPAGAAGGTTVAVGSAEELAELAGACVSDAWSRGKRVVLTADLDLTGTVFTPIPLFGGEFDGQGHTVRGISLTDSGSAQGLFRRILPGGTVCNLHVEGRILPQGSRSAVGGIAVMVVMPLYYGLAGLLAVAGGGALAYVRLKKSGKNRKPAYDYALDDDEDEEPSE